MRPAILCCALVGLTVARGPTDGQSLTKLGEVKFVGDIAGPNDVSGVALVRGFLAIVSDEAKDPTVVQILKKDGASYRVVGSVKLPAGDKEVDLEAVAADGDMVYVTGSHCWTRKVEPGNLHSPKRKESREQFFRFRLNADGTAGDVEGPKSLTPAIQANAVLEPFFKVASKENGVDIEGLTVKKGRLYFGFRGPVLRSGLVPVLSRKWDDPEGTAGLSYVRLGGRGIRDLAAVDGGFLVLAGPVGDGDLSYRLYFWDGADHLAAGEEGPTAQLLGEFPAMGKGKPEGLTVMKTDGKTYEVLMVCDGLPNGGATLWRATRP